MPRVEIVMQEAVRQGLYVESRRVHRNWLLMALILAVRLKWIWMAFASHLVYFFTRQFKRGMHAGGREVREEFLAELTQPMPVIEGVVVDMPKNRRSGSSGGWKIVTDQFIRGRHSDSIDVVDGASKTA